MLEQGLPTTRVLMWQAAAEGPALTRGSPCSCSAHTCGQAGRQQHQVWQRLVRVPGSRTAITSQPDLSGPADVPNPAATSQMQLQGRALGPAEQLCSAPKGKLPTTARPALARSREEAKPQVALVARLHRAPHADGRASIEGHRRVLPDGGKTGPGGMARCKRQPVYHTRGSHDRRALPLLSAGPQTRQGGRLRPGSPAGARLCRTFASRFGGQPMEGAVSGCHRISQSSMPSVYTCSRASV